MLHPDLTAVGVQNAKCQEDVLSSEMLDVKMKAVQWRLGRVKSREATLSTEPSSDATRDGMKLQGQRAEINSHLKNIRCLAPGCTCSAVKHRYELAELSTPRTLRHKAGRFTDWDALWDEFEAGDAEVDFDGLL